MHDARQQKAREIEERKAQIKVDRDRSSVLLMMAGVVALALVVVVAIKIAGALF